MMPDFDDTTRLAIEAAEQLVRDLREGRALVRSYERRPQTRAVHDWSGYRGQEVIGAPITRIEILWGEEIVVLTSRGARATV